LKGGFEQFGHNWFFQKEWGASIHA